MLLLAKSLNLLFTVWSQSSVTEIKIELRGAGKKQLLPLHLPFCARFDPCILLFIVIPPLPNKYQAFSDSHMQIISIDSPCSLQIVVDVGVSLWNWSLLLLLHNCKLQFLDLVFYTINRIYCRIEDLKAHFWRVKLPSGAVFRMIGDRQFYLHSGKVAYLTELAFLVSKSSCNSLLERC